MAKRGVTVKDVARESGFSLATCTHILGGRDERYSERTVEAVRAVAERIGYRPNALARSMRTGRTDCVALLGSTEIIRSVLPPRLLDALEHALHAAGKYLAIARLGDDAFRAEGTLPRLVHEWGCDGILVNYQKQVPPELERLVDASDLPAIWLNTKRSSDCVHPDEIAALGDATRRLIDLGHRRIAWVDALYGGIDPTSHFSVGDRWTGYAEAMRAAGLTPRALVAPDEGYLLKHTHLARARAWAAETQRPTAILATDPDLLASLIVAWRETGAEVPRDLSLVAVAPDAVTCIGHPIDTVEIPQAAMGRRAVELLMERVAGRGHRPAEALPAAYIPRGSTVPPAAGAGG